MPSLLWFPVIDKSDPDAKNDLWIVWRNRHFFDCALLVRIYVQKRLEKAAAQVALPDQGGPLKLEKVLQLHFSWFAAF